MTPAAPLSGVFTLTSLAGRADARVLPLEVSRSSVVRLAPIRAELARHGAIAGGKALTGPPRTLAAPSSAQAVGRELERERPDVALVAGDGDEVVAAALAATARGVSLVRLGAGLRCGDRGVRSELNRIVLDELADVLLTDGDDATRLLLHEGFDEERIACVGSTLADSALRWRPAAARRRVAAGLGLAARSYVLVTLQEHDNIAEAERVARVVDSLSRLARRLPTVLCLHPRARAVMEPLGDLARLRLARAILIDPLEYLDFLSLVASAGAVVTDSAGVQEETTVLGVRCFTLARASERTLTLTHGTNTLLGDDPADIAELEIEIEPHAAHPIPLWDGRAAERVARLLVGA